MGAEENKAVVRKWFEAVNRGDGAATLKVTAKDFIFKTMARFTAIPQQPAWLLFNWTREQYARVC